MIGKKSYNSMQKKSAIFGLVCVLIPLVAYVFFHIFPLIISFLLQFFDTEGSYDIADMKWNNFAAIKAVYGGKTLWKAFGVTLFMMLAQFTSLAIAIVTANALHYRYKGSTAFEVLFFIPHICSSVALSVIWKWMFDVDQGIINDVLSMLNLAPIEWHYSEQAYPWMIFVVIVWSSPGYGIIMYKSVFSSINKSIYEAADIDGATGWAKFWKVTFPELAPMTFYLLMLGIIAGMQTFEIAKIIRVDANNSGVYGPYDCGLTLMCYVYREFDVNGNLSNASVISWFLFIITLTLSIISFKVRRKWVDE